MSRQLVVVALLALLIVSSEALCPAVFRLVNAVVPNTSSLDLLINNVATTTAAFRGVTPYSSTTPGSVTITVRITGTSTTFTTRTVQAFPGSAYTVVATGSLTGPSGQLLFSNTPFIFQEDIFPPNPSNFRGVFHQSSELNQNVNFAIGINNASTIFNVLPKTAIAYSEQVAGSYAFTVTNTTGSTILNSQSAPVQINTTVTTGTIFDLFVIGNDANNVPNQFSTRTSSPSFDRNSGCILVDGSSVLPDNSPVVVSFTPVFCSASTLASGIAFLLALVALFF